MSASPSRRAAWVVPPLLLFVLLGLVNVWTAGERGTGIDFFQFWAVGQAVDEELLPGVYGADAWPRLARIFLDRARRDGAPRHMAAADFRREEIQTSNTPLLYAAFFAMESGSYESDIRRFRLLSLAVTVGSAAALCWCAGWSAPGALTFLAFLLWAFAPLQYDLQEGNVNGIQLGCMALFLLMVRGRPPAWREVLAGAALGAGVAFKPNLLFVPLALVIAWAVQRRLAALTRRVAGMIAGGLAGVLAGSLFFGSIEPWLAWVRTLSEITETFGSEVRWGSFGGARLLLDLTGANLSALLYLLALGAVGLAAWKLRGAGPAGEAHERLFGADFAVVGLGPLVPLLAADLAWPHYLVQTLPIVVWLLRPAGAGGGAGALTALGLAGICSSPVVDWLAPGTDYTYAIPLALGCLALFAAGILTAGRQPSTA